MTPSGNTNTYRETSILGHETLHSIADNTVGTCNVTNIKCVSTILDGCCRIRKNNLNRKSNEKKLFRSILILISTKQIQPEFCSFITASYWTCAIRVYKEDIHIMASLPFGINIFVLTNNVAYTIYAFQHSATRACTSPINYNNYITKPPPPRQTISF